MYKNKSDQLACGRRHYQRNKKDYADRRDRRRQAIVDFIRTIKSTLKCSRCPESDPRCIDFHHLDPSQKVIEIAKIPSLGWSIEKILAEIAKCIPLCSNCHRKETH